MTKQFKLVNKELQVTVENEDDVYIPVDSERKNIGRYTQTTVQTIKEDNIKDLKDFILSEKGNAEKQLKTLKDQLEPIKDLQDIDEKIIKHCKLAIEKGTKPFKTEMKKLNERIINLDKKKSIMAQVDYIESQLKEVNSDLDNLNKVLS